MTSLNNATAENAAAIRISLDRVGVAVVDNFFPPDVQQVFAREIIESADRARPSGGYKYSLKYDEIAHHSIYKSIKSNTFSLFVREIMLGNIDFDLNQNDIELGYSIIKHRGDRVPYHFDSKNCLNFIFPIVQPDRPPGYVDLICFPNVIGFKRSLRTRITSRVLSHIPVVRGMFRKTLVSYTTGSLYAFYGCRTFHGVEPYAFDGLRAVATVAVRWRTTKSRTQ